MKKGVNIIIQNKEKGVLVLKRSPDSDFSPNLWDLPGGKVKQGEDLNQAVIREAKEEVGLKVIPEDKPFYTYFYSRFSFIERQGGAMADYPNNHKQGAETAVYAIKTKFIQGEITLSKEHTEFKWILENEWTELNYTPSVKATLKILLKNFR
jgi:8-oxo-dGTP diphosphatase